MSSDRPRIVFRVDAGRREGLSFGHLYRCLALARELNGRAEPLFLLGGDPEGFELVRRHGFPVRAVASETNADAIAAEAPAVTVLDLPRLDPELLRRLDDLGRRTVVLDDNGVGDVPATVIVEGGFPPLRPAERTATAVRKSGPHFCILAPEFDGARRPPARPQADRILVTFGGSDPTGLTARAAQALAAIGPEVALDVVLGSGFGEARAADLAATAAPQVRIRQHVDNLCAMMLQADLAIAAAGRTSYELVATGTPAILIPSIGHECPVAAALAKAGAAVDLGPWQADTSVRLLAAVRRLIADRHAREAMTQAALATIDDQGRRRVAEIVLGVARDEITSF